jgi:8-oxo-dGTP pyrophosphatase MutT (NUDIX family)
VAALPLLQHDGRLAVVLVTSRETGRWVLPKGWAELGVSRPAMATKEAFEEAGLIGVIEPRSCGSYRYAKRLGDATTLICEVKVFTLRVTEMLDDWPEKAERRRHIVPPAEAAGLVEEAELAALLRRLD